MLVMEPQEAWLATQGQLQVQLQPATYETWVRDARFVSCQDDVFTISVRNAYAKDWLERRLHRVVQRTVSSILGRPVEIQFIIQPPAEKPPKPQEAPLLEPTSPTKNIPSPKAASLVTPPKEKAPPIYFGQGEGLNDDYLLENFIAGSGSQLAYSAAQAIAAAPGKTFNPLFIYGGVGLGKTHLLQAVGNACRAKGMKVLYICAETFTNDLVRAIRVQQTEAFRQFYRSADMFLVDDIQFIAGKTNTQQEFFHTFNTLYNQNRQIVLTADRKASDIDQLDERLYSRFESGLMVELLPPDAATRFAIVKAKAYAQDTDLPDDVAAFIAEAAGSSVRSLEGTLNQLIAKVALTRQPISLELATSLLEGHLSPDQKATAQIMDIFEATARYHQLTLDDLLSKQRSQAVALARHIAIYMAREEINATLPAIGRALGGRSHSTIINSYRKVQDMMAADPVFYQEIKALREQIHQQLS